MTDYYFHIKNSMRQSIVFTETAFVKLKSNINEILSTFFRKFTKVRRSKEIFFYNKWHVVENCHEKN